MKTNNNNGKTVAVIQARMGSARLRGKSLSSINGEPLIKRVYSTVSEMDFIDSVIVATSILEEDDPLHAYCSNFLKCDVIRGDSKDVFSRFLLAAEGLSNMDNIVRITADNIFYQKSLCQGLLSIHVENNNEYTGIKGLSHLVFEILSVSSLRNFCFSSLNEYEREHVTPYLINNPHLFKTTLVDPGSFGLDYDLDSQLTVDTKEDRDRIEAIINSFTEESKPFNQYNLYSWLKKHENNET